MKKIGIVFALLALIGLTVLNWTLPSQAAVTTNVITVTDAGDNMADNGTCSLREALHNANNNTQLFAGDGECNAGSDTQTDVIVLQSGMSYALVIDGGGDDEGDLDIRPNSLPLDLRIETDGEDPAIIQMVLGNHRVMEIHGAAVEIENVNFLGGFHSDFGGGIYNNGGTLTLSKAKIEGASANAGGGLYNQNGTVMLDETIVTGNSGALGGSGIVNTGVMTITNNSQVGPNIPTNGSGGGINNSGDLFINGNSLISANEAAFNGGGIYNNGGAVHLTDATVQENTAGDSGGGIYNDAESQLTLVNVAIKLNTAAAHGGGIFSMNGTVAIHDSLVEENTAVFDGGGIGVVGWLDTPSLELRNSIIRNNTANENGGGLWLGHAVTLHDITLVDNEAGQHGGGLFSSIGVTLYGGVVQNNSSAQDGGGLRTSTLTAYDLLVQGNTAAQGGGIYNNVHLELHNSRVLDNSATSSPGGGLYLPDGVGVSAISRTVVAENRALASAGGGIWTDRPLTLSNSTISNNSGFTEGGGLHIAADGDVAATNITLALNSLDLYKIGELTLQNSLIYTPDQPNCFLVATLINSLGHNISDDASCSGLDEPTDMVDANPMLEPLADNGGNTLTHALQEGSPAIGHGNLAACAAAPGANGLDQRGFLRDSVACDSGAYEYGLTLTVALVGDGQGSVSSDPAGIDCEAVNCVLKFPHNTAVSLTATPANDQFFVHWTGAVSSSNPTIVVTMDATKSITAVFSETQPLRYLYLPIINR
jgi:hypothetical protein